MTEHWFDTNNGELLNSQDIEQLQGGAYPGIVPLVDLLEAEDFEYQKDDFEQLDYRDLTPDDLRSIGVFALQVIAERGGPKPLIKKHIERLAILGLSPRTHVYTKHFDNLANFRIEIDSPPGDDRALYADWTKADMLDYCRKLNKGRKISKKDLDASHAAGSGPSYNMIFSRVGQIPDINEAIGYPNIHAWDDDDCVDFGVRLIKANSVDHLNLNSINVLTAKKLGPSRHKLYRLFGSWDEYKAKVQQKYDEGEESRQAKLSQYKQKLEQGKLPSSMEDADEETLLRVGGRFNLISFCARGMDLQTRQLLALGKNSLMIEGLRKYDENLTAGHIEANAVTLDVFDDIWPLESYKKSLKISDDELAAARNKKNKAYREFWAKRSDGKAEAA